jgi:lipopolysaccharide transport system ATP-binding protein
MSSNRPAVRVENLGKRYLIPKKRNPGSLGAHLKNFVPFLRDNEDDYFWALKNVSFEVQPGEILGILGKNGSGKSTLLKILSNVTFPTKGRVELCGRVGSLLEVGTGFHPDLTGRENVFMAGSLLGLARSEIKSQFDNIIDFSGIGKFIDTPVKRYSSGMYVRLAYSVASLLRSDVLILDEVMAVGDASFQEKSRANIEKLASEGRSILFVSHNERAVNNLCHNGIILEEGKITFHGTAENAVKKYRNALHSYTKSDTKPHSKWFLSDAVRHNDCGQRIVKWISLHAPDGKKSTVFYTGQQMLVKIGFGDCRLRRPYFSLIVHNEFSEVVTTVSTTQLKQSVEIPVDGQISCLIDDLRLGEGHYYLMVDCGSFGGSRSSTMSVDCIANAATFEVRLDGFLVGNGLDSYEGAAHRAAWVTCGLTEI